MDVYKTIAVHARSTYWTTKEQTEESVIDSDDLAKELCIQCNKLDKEGYEVLSVTPVSSGNLNSGSGYIQTESVIILAKKK